MNRRKYDWDELFARGKFVLRRGRDYTCSQASMAQQVRNAATSRVPPLSRVSVRDTGTSVVVEVLPEGQQCRERISV